MACCSTCGKTAGWQCDSCGLANYCSAACQSSDWSSHQATCKVSFRTQGGLDVGLDDFSYDLSDLMATHVRYTQDLLVATVNKYPSGVTRAISHLIDNKIDWVTYLEHRLFRRVGEWYSPGEENGGLGDGIFLRHSLAAKAVIDGVTGMDSSDNSLVLDADGGKAFATLFGASLDEIVDFWDLHRSNEELTTRDVRAAWKTHLDCTVEYARQLVLAGGNQRSPTYLAAARACESQGRFVGSVMESAVIR